MVTTTQPHNSAPMRYQIADGIIDLIHGFWAIFLFAAVGTFSMGGALLFQPLRDNYPHGLGTGAMLALIVVPMVAIWRDNRAAYALSRCLSALWFGYLAWICLAARPVSTGVIYVGIALGAALLAFSATINSFEEA